MGYSAMLEHMAWWTDEEDLNLQKWRWGEWQLSIIHMDSSRTLFRKHNSYRWKNLTHSSFMYTSLFMYLDLYLFTLIISFCIAFILHKVYPFCLRL